jgi:hypothetical protein
VVRLVRSSGPRPSPTTLMSAEAAPGAEHGSATAVGGSLFPSNDTLTHWPTTQAAVGLGAGRETIGLGVRGAGEGSPNMP